MNRASDALESAIKKEIGYTEDTVCCRDCACATMEENPHLDRDWECLCHIAAFVVIKVSEEGRCREFRQKTDA